MKIFTKLILFLFLMNFSLLPQSYEILFDVQSASGWFGGDNRSCCGPRNIGVGQSVLIDKAITLETFAFNFSGRFDYSENPTGSGVEVTLVLNIRDSAGTIIQTQREVVPDTFNGGWVTWSDINLIVNANTQLIFTCYLSGGYDSIQVDTGQRCDAAAGYPDGVRITKQDSTDEGMEEWIDWGQHSWDANFRLTGTELPVSVNENINIPSEFSLAQNYPNPFNPSTKITFATPQSALVNIKIYDLMGSEVSELINEYKSAGAYAAEFNAEGLSSGVYIYKITIIDDGKVLFGQAKQMVLLK